MNAGEIPDDSKFREIRGSLQQQMAEDVALRQQALSLQELALKYQYSHHYEWCGVPIIRHPDDLILLQEIFWRIRPAGAIETGIARGGGLLFSASLMEMMGLKPHVLGLDICILKHTHKSLSEHKLGGYIQTWEGDSASLEARDVVRAFIERVGSKSPMMLILDSDHSHEHVLSELRLLATQLPVGSVVVVADTLVEEMPPDVYAQRGWGPGNSPLSAVFQFLQEGDDFQVASVWARRGLITELRDGILIRVRN